MSIWLKNLFSHADLDILGGKEIGRKFLLELGKKKFFIQNMASLAQFFGSSVPRHSRNFFLRHSNI